MDAASNEIILTLQAGKHEKLAGYLASDQLRLIAPASATLVSLLQQLMALHKESLKEMEQRRLAQAAAASSPEAVEANTPAVMPNQEDMAALLARQQSERRLRYRFTHSFGVVRGGERGAAETLFLEKFAKSGDELADLRDLKLVCLEFGYWLGQDLESARAILNVDGSGLFSFRDLVSWWTQSERSWLFLLDNTGFKKRHAYVGDTRWLEGSPRTERLISCLHAPTARRRFSFAMTPTGQGKLLTRTCELSSKACARRI